MVCDAGIVGKRLIVVLVLTSLSCWTLPASAAASLLSALATKTHGHACCPKIEVPPPPEPCNQQPCCVTRAPNSPSSLPATASTSRPDSDKSPAMIVSHDYRGASRASVLGFEEVFPHTYHERSTVLRI